MVALAVGAGMLAFLVAEIVEILLARTQAQRA
jgi:hypothetical protein